MLEIIVVTGVWPDRSCRIYPVTKLVSPNSRYEVEQNQQICTPDNNLETIVWMHDKNSKRSWSIFTARSNITNNDKMNSISGVSLKLIWLSENEFKILYPSGTNVVQKSPSIEIHGVKTIYEEYNR